MTDYFALLGAFLCAFLIVLVTGRPVINFLHAKKIGQMIRSFEGFLLADLHKDKKNTPTMGGILVVVSSALSALIFGNASSTYLWMILIMMMLFGLIGALDDWRKLQNKSAEGLSARKRLFLQSLLAFAVIGFFYYHDHTVIIRPH
jgi:phospho-N-acetylmuramoyl-pentapeptide-transferase